MEFCATMTLAQSNSMPSPYCVSICFKGHILLAPFSKTFATLWMHAGVHNNLPLNCFLVPLYAEASIFQLV
jgi:hypothetical protein